MQTSPTTVEQLRHRLVGCLDEEHNVIDYDGLMNCLECIENAAVTKETLEATRLGLLINDLRKRFHQTQPDLSKKCRSIIKSWQKLLAGSASFSGSATGDGGPGSAACSPSVAMLAALSTPITPKTLYCKLIHSSNSSAYSRPSSSPGLCKGKVTPKSSQSTPTGTPVVINGHRTKPGAASLSPAVVVRSPRIDLHNEKPEDVQKRTKENFEPPLVNEICSPPPSLKIRIKMGGASADSASIVKSISVPSDLHHKATLSNGSSPLIQQPSIKSDKKSINATAALEPVADMTKLQRLESTQDSPMIISATTVVPKKSRQKRNLDQSLDQSSVDPTDPNDPLSSISRGQPLPRLKTTADLVTEMASGYPEEMAKSMASAAALGGPCGRDEVDLAAPMHNVGGFQHPKYSKHDDYLDVTKSELVAKYLRTTGTDIGSQTPASPAPISLKMKPLAPQATPAGKIRTETPSKSRKLENLLESSDKPGRAQRSKTKTPASDQSTFVEKCQQNANEPKKINWYDILPPLHQPQDNLDTVKLDPEISTCGDTWADFRPENEPVLKLLDDFDGQDFDLYSSTYKKQAQLHSRILVTFDPQKPAHLSTTTVPREGLEVASQIVADAGGGSTPCGRVKPFWEPVLALPYVDVGLPAFLEYKFPESQRHFAHWSEK